MAGEFLRLWKWVKYQDRHFSHEKQGKKHHKNGAQGWDLAPKGKKGAQSLMSDASYEPDQQQNFPNGMRAGPRCWNKSESDILDRQSVRPFQ